MVAQSRDGRLIYPRNFRPEPMRSYCVVLRERTSILGNRYYVAELATEAESNDTIEKAPFDDAERRACADEIRRLSEEIEALRNELRYGHDKTNELTKRIRSLTDENERLSRESAQHDESIATLEAEKKQLLADIQSATERANTANSDRFRDGASKEIETLRLQLMARDQMIKNNTATIADLEKQIAAQKELIRALNGKLRTSKPTTKRPDVVDSVDALLGKCRLEQLLGNHGNRDAYARIRNDLLVRIHPDKNWNLGPVLQELFEAVVKAVNAKYPNA